MEVQLNSELIKIVNIVEHYYRAPTDVNAGKLFYTTGDIYAKLQSIYPSDTYSPENVFDVLMYLGIETFNGAGSKIFWYLEER